MENELMNFLGPIMPLVLDKGFTRSEKERYIRNAMQSYAEAYHAAKSEQKQDGEQCFIDTEKLYELGAVLTDKSVEYLNNSVTAYVAKQNRELIAWKESAMKILSAVNNQEIGKLLGVPIGHSISDNLLEKIKDYRLDGMKKALKKAAENATTKKLDGGLPVVMIVDKESITNSKNLEV